MFYIILTHGLANTLFGVKAKRLLKSLSKIKRSARLRDIVSRINSCFLS